MAKDTSRAAQLTDELPGLPPIKKRGRPATGKAKTAAERQTAYREKHAADWSKWLAAAYRRGYADALEGKEPAPDKTWQESQTASAYLSAEKRD